jgi:hypothetical protein
VPLDVEAEIVGRVTTAAGCGFGIIRRDFLIKQTEYVKNWVSKLHSKMKYQAKVISKAL